jgi:glutamate/tyrosine decarboxylase-like PLP-dependent enzyme
MSQHKTRIRELEAVARQLEPSPSDRERMTQAAFGYASRFLDGLHQTPAFNKNHNHGRGLYESPIGEDPIDVDEALALFKTNVDEPALTAASGGHIAYIPGGGIYPASLGDYLAAVTNNFAGVYFASPGAVRMEHMLTRWMAEAVGMPASCGGDLTSGGSIAALIAIVTARDAHGLHSRDYDKAVVYMTHQAHHSIDKAIRVAGLGDSCTRYIDTDDHYRMSPQALETAIQEDKKNALTPWLVIASAGTTDAGAVDPLDDIAEITRAHGLWLHIDAAYGGFFVLCEEGRSRLPGISEGDSIIMDPHKALFLPYGCGAVLVRDREKMRAAHYYQANYMQDVEGAEDEYSPADHSPELTRHFRGARLWLPLKLFGLRPFRACLEEKLLLAQHFHDEIQKIDGFEVGPPPQLSLVTYRYVPRKGDADEFNKRLVEEVQKDGRVFISSTMLDGKFTLRMAAMAFRTHLDTIETALEVLETSARRLEAEA